MAAKKGANLLRSGRHNFRKILFAAKAATASPQAK